MNKATPKSFGTYRAWILSFLQAGIQAGLCLGLSGCFSPDLGDLPQQSNSTPNATTSPNRSAASASSKVTIQITSTQSATQSFVGLNASGGTPPYYFTIPTQNGAFLDQSSKQLYSFVANDAGVQVKFKNLHPTDPSLVQVMDNKGLIDKIQIYPQPANTQTPNGIFNPNDFYYNLQGGLPLIQAPQAWAVRKGADCSTILVAVIDSGIDYAHPDFNSIDGTGRKSVTIRIDDALNFAAQDNDIIGKKNISDEYFHGTHVAGIIGAAGNNGIGVTGVCWRANFLPLKVTADGDIITSDLNESVAYAISKQAKIINLSLGISGVDPNVNSFIRSLRDLIQNAPEVLFVAAAGNQNRNNDIPSSASYPASFALNNILSVAAIDFTDKNNQKLASFSNYGANSVHIAAPGKKIYSTLPVLQTNAMKRDNLSSTWDYLSGTSMAAPMVTGAAALIWSQNPNLRAIDVKNKILNQSDNLPSLSGVVQGQRRLNVYKALMNP